ncbi:LysR family transcriptional regulator [Bradyrhizobium iriomotense]|uniref:LysR family transcriptional regulator n=1 Tax=Bradyrhizobium iriomotense TaxID=441950 RepID=UPI003D67A002
MTMCLTRSVPPDRFIQSSHRVSYRQRRAREKDCTCRSRNKDCSRQNTLPGSAKSYGPVDGTANIRDGPISKSMTKVADTLRLSTSAISRYLIQLESRLGVRWQRITRHLVLTSESDQFYEDVRQVLASHREAGSQRSVAVIAHAGRLRVRASLSFCLSHRMTAVGGNAVRTRSRDPAFIFDVYWTHFDQKFLGTIAGSKSSDTTIGGRFSAAFVGTLMNRNV